MLKIIRFQLIGILFGLAIQLPAIAQQVDKFKAEWASKLEFKGVVLEEKNYHIWCTSPIWGNDGKVHLFVSRIPILPNDKNVKKGFEYWYSSSEIAQYTADKPEGPFQFRKVLLKPGDAPAGAWNCGTQHNPAIKYIDGKFVLLYHTNTSTVDNWTKKSHVIGMITATDINGPWSEPKMVLAPPAATDTAIWSHKIFGGIDNPTLLKHPKNGKYYLYYRGSYKAPNWRTVNTYGVAIAKKLEGPYVHYPKRVTNNEETRFIEDPYVFAYKKKIYLLMTDNYLNKGLLLSSVDGLFFEFKEGALGFDKMNKYIPDSIIKKAPNYHADKFERPQLLLKNGKPTYLYAPAGVNLNNGNGTACYLFKIKK
jgi:hypothetical protein